jgi:hypothetical protein
VLSCVVNRERLKYMGVKYVMRTGLLDVKDGVISLRPQSSKLLARGQGISK